MTYNLYCSPLCRILNKRVRICRRQALHYIFLFIETCIMQCCSLQKLKPTRPMRGAYIQNKKFKGGVVKVTQTHTGSTASTRKTSCTHKQGYEIIISTHMVYEIIVLRPKGYEIIILRPTRWYLYFCFAKKIF